MTQANEDLIRRGYQAFGTGDLDTLKSMMAPDVVHEVPGSNQFAGEHKGPDELMDMYGRLFDVSGGTYNADLLSIESRDDNTVVSTHRGTAVREGASLDTTETLTFTVEDGKITRIVSSFTPEDEAAEDAFWG
jgi:ketosteroid isomerase-like protein